MTYDENDDYNGPDSTRRGPFLFMAALVGVIMVAGGVAAASEVRAEPTQTVLPADGVTSITRTGDVWTVTLESADADEVKMITPTQQVACSEQDGMPKNGYPLCDSLTYTFVVAADCLTVQVDWTGNLHNSSDPVICLGGTPSTSQSPTEPPVPSEPPATVVPTTTPYEPTSPPSTGLPTITPTSSPTSTPEPSSSSSPTSPSSPNFSQPPSASTDTSPLTLSTSVSSGAPARLADTGTNIWGLGLVMLLTTALGLGAIGIGRRTS